MRLNPFRKRRTCTELKCGRCVEVRAQEVAKRLADKFNGCTANRLFHYALAVVVIGMPVDRALTYLEDCGTVESAIGRLYVRAAERAFKDAGENGVKYDDDK